MELIDDEIYLIERSQEYLHKFLSEFGTFYPFAMIMDNERNIYPLEHEITEEYPNPNSIIDLYERTFENEIIKGNEYKLGILCIDVLIGSDAKRDAIEIRLTGAKYRKKLVQYYEITESNTVIFQELVGW